jgi:hypothetical protein
MELLWEQLFLVMLVELERQLKLPQRQLLLLSAQVLNQAEWQQLLLLIMA